MKRIGQILKTRFEGIAGERDRPGLPQDEVVDDRELGKIEGILVEHADAETGGSGRRAVVDGFSIHPQRAGCPGGEARQDLHQCAFAGAVFTEDAVQLPGATVRLTPSFAFTAP